MDKILEATRELCKLIQAEDSFKSYVAAKEANDADEDLQKKIGEFNLIRLSMDQELSKEDKDEEKIKAMNEELRAAYAAVISTESMQTFQVSKQELDKLVNGVYSIISRALQGENPDELEFIDGCSGDCSGCSGCH